MDIIEQIEIPSFERRKQHSWRRTFAVAAGCVGLLCALERYNGSVSRTCKSLRRGLTAAVAAWIEEHGSAPLFPLEDDTLPMSPSVLDINGLCGPRLSHDAAAAALLAARQQHAAVDAAAMAVGEAGEGMSDAAAAEAAAARLFASADTPNFFQSTKFFACLDVDEARELFRATRKVSLAPHEVLFRSGDPSDSGIFIVVHGALGVFLESAGRNTPPIHANTLRSGESVGDLDVVDGAARSVSCMALETGCLLVNVPRELFMEFVHMHPRALLLYLQQGLARLWRVAHFVLADFLQLQLHRPKRPSAEQDAALGAVAAAAAAGGAGREPLLTRSLSNLVGHDIGTQTDPGEGLFGSAAASRSASESQRPGPGSGVFGAGGRVRGGVEEGDVGPGGRLWGQAAAGEGVREGQGEEEAQEEDEPLLRLRLQVVEVQGERQPAVWAEIRPTVAGYRSVEGSVHGAERVRHATALRSRSQDVCAGGARLLQPPLASAAKAAEAVPAEASSLLSVASLTVSSGPSVSSASGSSRAPSPLAPSEPTFNELLASAAASARLGGARGGMGNGGGGGPPKRLEGLQPNSGKGTGAASAAAAAAAAAAALMANVPTTSAVPPTQVAVSTGGGGGGIGRAEAGGPTGHESVASAAGAGAPHPSSAGGVSSGGASALATARADGGSEPVLIPPPHTQHYRSGGKAFGTMASAGSQPPPPAASSDPSYGRQGSGGERAAAWSARGAPAGGEASSKDPYANDSTRPQGPVCRMLPPRAQSLRRSFVLGARACLANGWDVVDVEEAHLDDDTWAVLSDPRSRVGTQLPLAPGGLLQDVDWAAGCLYVLLDGHLLAERPAGGAAGGEDGAPPGGGGGGPGPVVQESALISPGSLVSCAAFLSSTAARCKVVALEPARLVAFSWQTLEALVVDDPGLLIRLLLCASAALGPIIRRFISLGLNRMWLESGDVAYRQGDFAECLYVVISGRLRLLHETQHPVTLARQLHLEEEVGRGEAVGAVWAITGGHHDTTALCVRDSELVRMSRSAFRVISADSPLALSKLFSNIARRLVAAWDSRVRSDRGAGSTHTAAANSLTSSGAGVPSSMPSHPSPRPMGLRSSDPGLPNPARLGLTPLRGAGQLAAGGGGRGPRSGGGRRGEIVTIAIMPAGVLPDATAQAAMAAAFAGSPNDVAAAAAALAAAEAAAMGHGRGRTPHRSGDGGGEAAAGASWRSSAGFARQQAGAVAMLTAVKRLSGSLKDALGQFGPVLLLDATVLSLQFPIACERLDVLFYRSKVTSWMAAQEEEYRFILLEADVTATPWSAVCVAQADCILLVAPEGATPALSQPESLLVFNAASPAFARPKPLRSGLTPAASSLRPFSVFTSNATSAAITPSASFAHLSTPPTPAGPALGHSLPHSHRSPLRHGSGIAGDSPAPVPAATAPNGTHRRASSSGAAPNGPTPNGPHPLTSTSSPGSSMPPSRASSVSASGATVGAAAAGGGSYAAGVGGAAADPSAPLPAFVLPSAHSRPHQQQLAALFGASSAAMLRRVELVVLHPDPPGGGALPPAGTADWLAARPNLSRHHHVRLGRQGDVQRLARIIAGKAVGIVLCGGGSRGLAHLGVLTALEDAGVPLDCVGGTSQGAFMAALYAQGLGREALQQGVLSYATQLGSVRRLLADLTLPVLSLFSGSAFDDAVKRVFARGAQRLEDLWLPFFCVTTNLTRGEASVHTTGLLWKLVRASMTIVGLLPPVCEDGCLLVDGGYMNNTPVDVMRSLMGVDSVLVVDVEGRDEMGWRNLATYDGGLSGWRLLWDRWCPVPSWRFSSSSSSPASSLRPLRYASLINKLTWMTHAASLRRVAAEHRIDLYLRPPGAGAKSGYSGGVGADPAAMDRVVKDAYRYATSAITQWKAGHRVGPCGIEDLPPPPSPSPSPPPPPPPNTHPAGPSFAAGGAGAVPPSAVANGPGARVATAGGGSGVAAAASRSAAPLPLPHHGASCMSQLQKKQHQQQQQQAAEAAEGRGTAMPPTPTVRFRVDGEPPPPPPSGGGYRWHGSTAPPLGTGGGLGVGAGAQSPGHPYPHHAPTQPTSIMRKSLDDPDRAAGRGAGAYARGVAGPGTGQVRIQAQPAHGSSPFEGKGGLAWSPPGLPGALSDDGVQAAGAEGPGAEQQREHGLGQGPGQSSPVVGSPPLPSPSLSGDGEGGGGGGGGGLRRIASKMSRSATRHSLIDLCKDDQD